MIDQTLVGRSADAFDASRSPQQRLDGLLHLSILLDAVALHERLFTIPSRCEEREEFRRTFREHAGIRMLDELPQAALVQTDLETLLVNAGSPDRVDRGRKESIKGIVAAIGWNGSGEPVYWPRGVSASFHYDHTDRNDSTTTAT